MFRQLIKALKFSVGTSIRSASTTSDAISQIKSSIRQAFPRAKISIIIVPKYKIIVSAPEFSFQSVKDRHQSVMANIPSEYRDQVEIQAIADDDSELVHLELPQSIPFLKREEIPSTPQVHLDNAVYFLSNGHEAAAGECAWLPGSLQLKIYAKAYGIAIKSHDGKKMLVSFINKRYNLPDDFLVSWLTIQLLHINSYEDTMPCEELEANLKRSVLFSNQLFDLKATAFSKEEFQDYIKITLKFGHLFKENTEGKRNIDSYFKFD